MNAVTLVFPHQLFDRSPAIAKGRSILALEEHLFYRQYQFHKRRLAFQRAALTHYVEDLRRHGHQVELIESTANGRKQNLADIRHLDAWLASHQVQEIHYCDPHDDWLDRRLLQLAERCKVRLVEYESPQFMTSRRELEAYFSGKRRMNQTEFYIHQRKRLNLLLDEEHKPLGGKWSFDAENRKRYPKDQQPPRVRHPKADETLLNAISSIEKDFPKHYGQLDDSFNYPVTRQQSLKWLDQFLEHRFTDFGIYEDAIQLEEAVLHHSLLSPLINVGLLTPHEVVHRAVEYAEEFDVPLNSLEGFVRQIVGWREFIRAVYQLKGREQRTRNFWGFSRRMPAAFWNGTTGIDPLDQVIQKVEKNAYCHHIERLMVLGNFMLLCEFDPDDVYRWFMEMFIDAYDWVMVPNVYGMSQFADGGLMSTKPYLSGSNYLIKMSNAKRGPWQELWDALFWRFMEVHRDFFSQNPRLGMLLRTLDAMPAARRKVHLSRAQQFLDLELK